MVAAALGLPRRLASPAMLALVIAYATVAVLAARRAGSDPPTSYAGASTAAFAADLVAGLGLLAAGLLVWTEPRTRRLAPLALLAGVVWFGTDWEGWQRGLALARSLGAVSQPLFLALVFHLVVSFPTGRLRSRPGRDAVALVYAIALLASLARALFRSPLLDLYCWRDCLANSFLVHADPGLAQTLWDVWLRSAVPIGVVLLAVAAWRLAVSSAPARRATFPGLVPGALVGAAHAAYAAALLHTPLEDPRSGGFAALYLIQSTAVTALALGLTWSVLRSRRIRTAVNRLAGQLGDAPPPGKLRETLASAVGDELLDVIYPLDGSLRFVDGSGRPASAPVASNGRVVTPIARDGQAIALVVHDAALLDGSRLEREVGAAARLAVENERLQAEVLAQLGDLRASRNRIVERGDTERRRLERDLHDGAQQRLLALSYELRLAQAGAEADCERELAALLDDAIAETQTALHELRELAQGIYPVVLTEAGLAPALATLADAPPVRIKLGEVTTQRFSAAIETAAYLTVAEAVEDAAARAANFAAIDVSREGDQLVVLVRDDGEDRVTPLVHLGDRIGALGGRLITADGSLRAEIPCA